MTPELTDIARNIHWPRFEDLAGDITLHIRDANPAEFIQGHTVVFVEQDLSTRTQRGVVRGAYSVVQRSMLEDKAIAQCVLEETVEKLRTWRRPDDPWHGYHLILYQRLDRLHDKVNHRVRYWRWRIRRAYLRTRLDVVGH